MERNCSKGIGGGGFLLPKTSQHLGDSGKQKYIGGVNHDISAGGWVPPGSNVHSNKFDFDNSFGRYGGGKELSGKSRSMKLFSESGRKSFAVGFAGRAGFAGKAEAGLTSMEAYHRYKQYKAMMKYMKYKSCYNNYCGNGNFYHRRYHCVGGCRGGSFCDSGMCRCSTGYYPY